MSVVAVVEGGRDGTVARRSSNTVESLVIFPHSYLESFLHFVFSLKEKCYFSVFRYTF